MRERTDLYGERKVSGDVENYCVRPPVNKVLSGSDFEKKKWNVMPGSPASTG